MIIKNFFLLSARFKLKKIVKSVFHKSPNLLFFLKKNFYFTLPGVLDKKQFYLYSAFENSSGKNFFLFPFDGKIIAFATGPFNDNRGIGRITRNLFLQIAELIDFRKEFATLSIEKRSKYKDYDLTCVDVYFFSSIHWCKHSVPENSVVMIMDVIPLVLSKFFPKVVVNNWEKNFKSIAEKCNQIVTISNSKAQDITKILSIDSKKISVISPGLERIRVANKSRHKIPTGSFVLFLGSNDFHKNAEVVIQALAMPLLKKISIVFVGENEELQKTCKCFGISNRSIFFGRLQDEDKAFVMSSASLLVFPSLYEGFGLPPMEAALMGVPSVCSRRPAMTEVLNDCALFADPHDCLEWSEQIYKLIHEPYLRSKIIKKASEKANKLCWRNSSQKLLKLLSKY